MDKIKLDASVFDYITILESDYNWKNGYNEFLFVAQAGEDADHFTFRQQRHDDGYGVMIYTRDNQSILDNDKYILSYDDFDKAVGYIEKEINIEEYRSKINSCKSLDELQDERYGYAEDERSLTRINKDAISKLFSDKLHELEWKSICQPIPSYRICDEIGIDSETVFILDLTTEEKYDSACSYLKQVCEDNYHDLNDKYIGEKVIFEFDSTSSWYLNHGTVDEYLDNVRNTLLDIVKDKEQFLESVHKPSFSKDSLKSDLAEKKAAEKDAPTKPGLNKEQVL